METRQILRLNAAAVWESMPMLNVPCSGKLLRASPTTFIWKHIKGTLVIPVPNGKKGEDWTIRLPVPNAFIFSMLMCVLKTYKKIITIINMSYKIRVYKIVNDVDDLIYIGSTKNKLSARFHGHKKTEEHKKRNIHKHMDNLGHEHFKIILIDEFIVENRDQQRKHEQNEIDKYSGSGLLLNTLNAYQSPSNDRTEYYSRYENEIRDINRKREIRRQSYARNKKNDEWDKKNKDYHREYMRKYRQQAKERRQRLNGHTGDGLATDEPARYSPPPTETQGI